MRGYKSFSLLLIFFISLGIALPQEGGRTMLSKDWYQVSLSNLSFEEGEGNYPSDWDRWGKGDFFWSGEAYDGKRSAGLRKTDWSTGWRSQSFPVFADYQKDYTWFYCEAYLKTKGASGRIFLSIAWYGEKGWLGNSRSPYFVNPDTDGWEPIFLYALPPKGATRGEIILRVDKEITGTVLFDAVKLYSLSFPISSSVEEDITSPYYAFISEYPGNPLAFESYLQIALAEEDRSNFARAREIYQTMGDIYSPFKPWALFRAVECSIKMKDYKKAKEIAEKVGKEFPSFKGEANYWLSEAYKEEGNYEESLSYAKKSLEDSKKGDWFISRAKLNQAYALERLRRFEEAKAKYKELTEKHIDQRPIALLGVANCAFPLGQYKTAIQYVDRLLEEYPNIYDDAIREAEFLKGRCYIALKEDTSKIVSYFRKLMEKYPDTEFGRGAWAQIVYAYLMGGKMEQAQEEEEEKIINQYKDTHPEFVAQTLSEWGNFFYSRGEYEQAIKKYFEAMKMNPKLTQELQLQISSCFELVGDYENAIKYLEMFLEEMDKGGKTGLKDAGWILWKLMRNYEHKFDFHSAINAYHRFKSLMPTDDPMAELTKFRLGYCYLQVGDCEKACKVWQEIVEETSKDYYLHDVAERVLRNYRDEPPYLPSVPSSEKEKKARIIGAINSQLSEAFDDFLKGKVLIIYGGRKADEEAGTNFKNFNKDKFGYNLPCKKDTEVSEGELKENNLVLFGTPTSNKVMRALSDYLPIKIWEKRIEVGSKSYDGEKTGVIMLIPNPFNEEKFVLIYTSYNPKLQLEAQSVFHGPTDYVIFSEEPEKNLSILEEGFFYKRSGRRWEVFPRGKGD
jgi:tetratricopeptide (TPR) repeat protein